MATLKLTIDNRRNYKDGRYPVIFRLTSNAKSTSIYTGVKLLPKEWDSYKGKVNKSHSDFRSLNILLKNRLLELESKLLEINSTKGELSLPQLKDLLLNGNQDREVTLLEFGLKEVEALKDQEKYGNAQSYETALNRFIRYAGKEITLKQVNYTAISGFDTQLIKEGLSRNSVAVYMRELRALLNKAINKGLMDKASYPFSSYRIKTEKTVNRAVCKEELNKIKLVELSEGSTLWHSRNIFHLIFNLIGISFIDLALLKPSSINNGRIIYRRRKTGKIYSIKITPEARQIINYYHKEGSKLI